MSDSPTIDVLLRHGGFIQRLAHELVRDPHAAEDLAQETRARWLEQGSAGIERPRAWLRRVARNLAINRAAASRRRRTREEASARAEALPSAAADAAEAELLHAVSSAVLALDEPYRSTIVARYYHGLDARRLAEESGTPLATVRSREQRALAKLRESLDREHGGRAGWALALARLGGLGGRAAAVVVPFWFAAACLVGALGLWVYALRVRGAEHAPVEPNALASSTDPDPGAPAAGTGGATTTRAPASPARTETSVRAASPSSPAPVAASTDPAHALVKGRLLLANGSPAAETVVRVQGFSHSEERERSFGLPADWQDPETVADERGAFALSFAPPAAFQFILFTERPAHASARWNWSELRPGSTHDVGDVVLYEGGVVEGRLVDANGRPLNCPASQGWRVSGASIGIRSHAGRGETYVSSEVADDGRFRVEGMHPGLNSIGGRSPAARFDAPHFRIQPGERLEIDLVYRGPDLARRVTVLMDNGAGPFDVPPASGLQLLGSVRVARRLEGSASAYVFDDVEPGSYTLTIDDPRCRPWRQDGVQPGVPVRAHVVGSAALALTVLAEGGTTPVPAFEVRLRPHGNGVAAGDHLAHDGSAPLADGILTGVYPGDYTLTVLSADREARTRVDDLRAGEVRSVTLRLEAHPSRISGRVLRPDGEPAPAARVRLIRPALQGDSDATPILPATGAATSTPERFRHELAVVETDAHGAFGFAVPEPGSFLVEASMEPARVLSASFALAAGDSREDLEFVLGAPASLRGRALGPPGAAFEGLSLSLHPVTDGNPMGRFMTPPALVVPLASDGSFTCASAPTGEHEVWLALPLQASSSNAIRVIGGSGSRQASLGNERLLGRVELAAGARLERDFDLASLFPGTVVVTAETHGGSSRGVEVALLAHDRGGPDANTRRTVHADSEGLAQPAVVFPGAWDVFVFSEAERWLHVHAVPVEVAPASRVELVVPIQRHAGVLTCLDASGQPFANQDLRLADAEERFLLSAPLRTDSNGRLELCLSPGTYRLRKLVPGASGEVAEFRWTAQGPAEPTLRF